jgi:hypothetical protein
VLGGGRVLILSTLSFPPDRAVLGRRVRGFVEFFPRLGMSNALGRLQIEANKVLGDLHHFGGGRLHWLADRCLDLTMANLLRGLQAMQTGDQRICHIGARRLAHHDRCQLPSSIIDSTSLVTSLSLILRNRSPTWMSLMAISRTGAVLNCDLSFDAVDIELVPSELAPVLAGKAQ